MPALTATALALLTAVTLLPRGSLNRDESTYLEFADLLRTGRLTLDAGRHAPFRPWASGILDGRVVLKYTPPWPAVLAAFRLGGTGALRLAPALTAGVAVLLVHALARRLGPHRTEPGALFAATAFALSPFVIIQGATFLSYLFQLVLGLAAGLLLLRRTRGAVAVAGLVTGVAAIARPFDAVLFIAPFAAVSLWRRRDLVVPFVLGGLPPAVALLAYDAAVLGSPFRLPFTVTGRTDGFGFGRRGIFPGATVKFAASDGLEALATNGGWLLAWVFGGPLLLVLAVLGYRRLGPSPARRALVGVAVVYPVGYAAFWGSYAVVHFWRGAATLGPFYHLPLVVPLAVFAGHGLASLPRRAAAGAVALAVVVTVAWLPAKVDANRRVSATYAAAADAVDGIDATDAAPAILLAPDRGVRGYDSWTPFLHNRPDLRQPLLYADDRGARDLDLLDLQPGRRLLRLVPQPTTNAPRRFRVEPLTVLPASSPATFAVRIDPALAAGARSVQPYLVEGRRELHQPLPPGGRLTWTLTADVAGAPFDALVVFDRRGTVSAGVEVVGNDGRRRRFEQRVPYRVRPGGVELLVPGRGFRRVGRRWVAADVAEVVRTEPPQGT